MHNDDGLSNVVIVLKGSSYVYIIMLCTIMLHPLSMAVHLTTGVLVVHCMRAVYWLGDRDC